MFTQDIFPLFLPPVLFVLGTKRKILRLCGKAERVCVLSLARKAKPTPPPSLISEKRKETLCLKSGCGYFLPRNFGEWARETELRQGNFLSISIQAVEGMAVAARSNIFLRQQNLAQIRPNQRSSRPPTYFASRQHHATLPIKNTPLLFVFPL